MPSRDGLNTFIIGGYSPVRHVAIFFFVAKMSKVKLRERCGWLQVLIQKFLMQPVTLGMLVSFRKGIIMKRIAVPGIFHLVSAHSMKACRNCLESALTTAGFTIFARFNHSRAAATVGLQPPPTLVLVFGNPKGGTGLMRASPTLGIDLPSRFLLRENRRGKTDVSFSRMAYAAQRHALQGKASEIAAFDAKVIAVLRRALLHQAAAA